MTSGILRISFKCFNLNSTSHQRDHLVTICEITVKSQSLKPQTGSAWLEPRTCTLPIRHVTISVSRGALTFSKFINVYKEQFLKYIICVRI